MSKKFFFKAIKKSPIFTLIIAKIIQLYLLIVFKTSKISIDIHQESDLILRSNTACLLSLWHGKIIMFPKIMKQFGKFYVLTSQHGDGNYIDKFVKLYGHDSIRGSSSHGSFSSTKDIVHAIRQNQKIVITPDGPRGPRNEVNSAITNFAAKFKIPIICLSFAANKVKTLNTWDHFTIPLPFAKIWISISGPYNFTKTNNIELEKIMLKQLESLQNNISVK